MRITKMGTQGKNALIVSQILLTNPLGKCIEMSFENLYLHPFRDVSL